MAAAEDYSPTHLVSSIFNFYWRLGADALTIARRALIVVGAAVEGATHLTLTVIGAATGGVEASVSDNAARPNFVPGMWEVASKARGNRGCPRKCLSRRRRRLAAAESAAAYCWLHGPTKAFPSLRPQGAFYLSKAILQELPEPVRHHLPAALLLHAEEAGGEEGVSAVGADCGVEASGEGVAVGSEEEEGRAICVEVGCEAPAARAASAETLGRRGPAACRQHVIVKDGADRSSRWYTHRCALARSPSPFSAPSRR